MTTVILALPVRAGTCRSLTLIVISPLPTALGTNSIPLVNAKLRAAKGAVHLSWKYWTPPRVTAVAVAQALILLGKVGRKKMFEHSVLLHRTVNWSPKEAVGGSSQIEIVWITAS